MNNFIKTVLILIVFTFNILAGNLYYKSEYKRNERIDVDIFKEFKENNFLFKVGFNNKSYFSPEIILGTKNLKTNVNDSIRYDYDYSFVYGIGLSKRFILTKHLEFGYDFNWMRTDFSEEKDSLGNKYKLRYDLLNFDAIIFCNLNYYIRPYVKTGYHKSKFEFEKTFEKNINNDKRFFYGVGTEFEILDNVIWFVEGGFRSSEYFKSGLVYNFKLKPLKFRKKVESEVCWVCERGHKFYEKTNYCPKCGRKVKKIKNSKKTGESTKIFYKKCPVCSRHYPYNSKINFCEEDGSKLELIEKNAEPIFKWIDETGEVYYNKADIPERVKVKKYLYDEKVLVGYQSTGTGKIYKNNIKFCPETGKPVIPLFK